MWMGGKGADGPCRAKKDGLLEVTEGRQSGNVLPVKALQNESFADVEILDVVIRRSVYFYCVAQRHVL